MPRLNYSKWDQLELSDDSDIEGHPNVDKKSLIRWKQRDIHEKREQRKERINQLRTNLDCNQIILPRIQTITEDVKSKGHTYYSSVVERLKTEPSPEALPTNDEDPITYDGMILSLLLQVWDGVKEKGVGKDDPELDKALVEGLQEQVTKIAEDQEKMKIDLESEEKEQAKKITSEDMYEGWDSKYEPPKPAPPPVIPPKQVKKKVTKETTFETLNPTPQPTSTPVDAVAVPEAKEDVEDGIEEDEEEEDDDDALPELTPALQRFSRLPIRGYQESWTFIQQNREVVVPGATDALLVAAFAAERQGEKRYAKQCVHQGLLLQYCEKLGRDGVSLFFKRMVSGDKRAEPVFLKDVEDTYSHLAARVVATQAEDAAAPHGREQIQLMQEDPSQPITFNVPDGPPPEHLRLEGPGTEDLDIEQVRRALQMRWDVFQAFDAPLRKALKKGTLDAVNKVLGKLEVNEAEETVRMLEMAGILSFADEGRVRDLTQPGGGKPTDEGDDADVEDEDEEEDEEDEEDEATEETKTD